MIEGSAQHLRIVNEAKQRGFTVEEIAPWHVLLKKDDVFHLKQGIVQEWLTEESVRACKEKGITKLLFRELGIPAPISHRFTNVDELSSIQWNKNYVVKPESGSSGEGVRLHITSIDDVHSYFEEQETLESSYLLEEFVEGRDLRIQVIGGKIVAACERIPASVIGDGVASLKQLINARRKEVKRQNPSNSLTVDAESVRLMQAQGVELSSILPNGKTVYLKEIANIGQGGKAVDCTDEIDLRVANWIDLIVERLNAPYFALDILCTDPMNIQTYQALEINLKAEWFHHTFSERRQHNLEILIVDELEKGIKG